VTSAPSFHFQNMQVMDTTTNSMTDRIIIFSKVKDYDAWKKSFDEHSDVRKNGGVTDRGVGYSYDDKNNVTVVLAINDMKKARDFIKSPELRARMDSAGVIGKPDIFFYHVVKQY
jgi:adenylosuccinate synthase